MIYFIYRVNIFGKIDDVVVTWYLISDERKRLSSRAGGSRYSTHIVERSGNYIDHKLCLPIGKLLMLVFLIRIKTLLKPTRIIETDFSSPDKKIEPRTQNRQLWIKLLQ